MSKPTIVSLGEMLWDVEIEQSVRDADVVCFGTLGQRSKQTRETVCNALRVAIEREIPRVLDINLREGYFSEPLIRSSIKLATVLKLSDEELEPVCRAFGIESGSSEEKLRQLLDLGSLALAVMTCGSEGAIPLTRDLTIHQAGISTKVKDAVGAGDAFTAIFVLGLLRGECLETLLLEACRYASDVCRLTGALPPKPQHTIQPKE